MRLSPLMALQGVFFVNALALGLWLPRIPDVKAALDLEIWMVAVCLMGAPIGTSVGFLFAPAAVRKLGLKMACIVAGAGTCIVLIMPALMTNGPMLMFSLFIVGLNIALIEVAMNSKANVVQRDLGRRIMSRCHGFWSFGMMSGGLVAGYFAQAGWSVAGQQFLTETLAAILAIIFALALPQDSTRDDVEGTSMSLPKGPIVILCLLPIGALMVEGAMLEWSVLYLREEVLIEAFSASFVFAVFAMAMGFARLAGDWATDRLGVMRVLFISGLLMFAGMVIFSLSGSYPTLVLAAAFAGVGSANVYPLVMSIAPDVEGGDPEQTVATVALAAFTAFLIGPPLIGFVGDAFSLSVALLILAPIGFTPALFVLSGWLGRIVKEA